MSYHFQSRGQVLDGKPQDGTAVVAANAGAARKDVLVHAAVAAMGKVIVLIVAVDAPARAMRETSENS